MSSVGHGEDGDDEATVRFRNAGTEEVDGVVDPVLRCTIRGDEEVDVVEVAASVCSAESEDLHGGVASLSHLNLYQRFRRPLSYPLDNGRFTLIFYSFFYPPLFLFREKTLRPKLF